MIYSLLISLAISASITPSPSRFFMIVLENENQENVMKDPYFANLAASGQSLTNFHAETHPSQGNYIAMIAGNTYGVSGPTGDNDITLDVKSIVDLLEGGGRSWTTYQQGYPGNCSTASRVGKYARKHNPFISIKNIKTDPSRCAKIVNSDQLAVDILNQNVPEFVFYTPDLNNDGHDTSIAYSSTWLQAFLDPLLVNPYFKNTLFMVTYDENEMFNDHDNNRIYTVLLGAGVKMNSKDNTEYNHYSILAYLQKLWGLGSLGLKDKTATPLVLK